MQSGTVLGLFIAPEAGAPMQPVEAVRAVPGRGLEGDRYFFGEGAFSRWPGPRREVSLIAEEDLETMARETGLVLAPSESRRNVLTRGVPLRQLRRRAAFSIGEVRLRGLRPCPPCRRLERLTGRDGLVEALTHRGGLRAQILTEGTLHVGDAVRF